MTQNIDDVHSYDTGFLRAMERLQRLDILGKNVVSDFITYCRVSGLAKSTVTNHLNHLTRMSQRLKEIGITRSLIDLQESDFQSLLLHLEDRGICKGEIRNYKKVVKKLYKWKYKKNAPDWINEMRLESIDSPVQPSDLLTRDEVDRLLGACRHPRNSALIAVMLDSGMRIGAVASLRIKNVELTNYGGILYISKTSRSRKTAEPRGIPITWSVGHINQWLAVHPLRNNPEAPLWTTLQQPYQPVSYKTIRVTVQEIAENAGITKRVNLHGFRHWAITSWILDGLSEQEVKHRAGWSKGSTQLFKIYANFTDKEINDKIFGRYGLKQDSKPITLDRCPRCNNILRGEDRVCSQCSLILDYKLAGKIQNYEKQIPQLIELLLKSDETKKLLEGIIK